MVICVEAIGGELSWGEVSGSGFFLGGICPGGSCPGGNCPCVGVDRGETVQGELSGGIYLEPYNQYVLHNLKKGLKLKY